MAESVKSKTVALPAVVDLDSLGSRVERVSTNALVMLLSAARTAERNSVALTLQGPSAPMLVAIDRLGFSPSFAGMMKG
jgi:hypothetical protein